MRPRGAPHISHPDKHPSTVPEGIASGEPRVEQIARLACREVLQTEPGYQGTFSFGTPGGNDLDLRLCFADPSTLDEAAVRRRLLDRLHANGVDIDIDLLFMSGDELATGRIRDLVELGDVSERLMDGFDPHVQQAAVGDTSLFSLYIFATMRELDKNPSASGMGSPESALAQLELTRDGAVGWTHFYTGTFLHDYLRAAGDTAKYAERVAKYTSRVIMGSTLAQLSHAQLQAIKPQLIDAIRAAGPDRSTDETISQVLLTNSDTQALLDPEVQKLLIAAGKIRSGKGGDINLDHFIEDAEPTLFYEAFKQGVDRRQDRGEAPDSLTSYALGELIWSVGQIESLRAGEQIMGQGDAADRLYYIPLKTEEGLPNPGVDIVVRKPDGQEHTFARAAGQILGEAALFGLPRSATVTAREDMEMYGLDAEAARMILTDPVQCRELQQQAIASVEAKRIDVLLRYLAREAAVYTRHTLAYTNKIDEARAQTTLGDNPLALYSLGSRFHDTLQLIAQQNTETPGMPITHVATAPGQRATLFEAGQANNTLYVVSEGTVQITLQNGETVNLPPGEYLGESSLLGMSTTGTATLAENSRVLAIDAQWFKRFTQSRQPIPGTQTEERPNGVLPVHLLYHMAAKGYDRVRGRLVTQEH